VYDTRQRAAQFVSISKYITAEAIKIGVPASRILDIPNPAPVLNGTSVTPQQWRDRFKLPSNAIVLAHVGRMVRWKGQLEFLDAFSQIAANHPNAYALIVGDDVEGLDSDYPRVLKRLVAERGLSAQVVFTGHIDNIMELMAFADVVVHSSIEPEPFGLVITEAMSAGAAVIAARLGAPIDLVNHGITGLLVDPTNTVEFSQALVTLISDESLRKRITAQGQRDAHEKYSLDSFAKQLEAVYRQVAKPQ
jgi:glycosyltransferase involved in cell wall biosynthesis